MTLETLLRMASWCRAGTAGLLLGFAAACAQEPIGSGKAFATPDEAAEALVVAAERHDIPALTEILGKDGLDLVATEDTVLDRNQMAAFAAQARQQMRVVPDSAGEGATIVIGADEWPVPIPLVERRGAWHFNTVAGRQEVLDRRIGSNELYAIDVALGYVEAQREYASTKRDGAIVNQYAQRIVSTPGKQDGLAWRAKDGSWQGPVGEHIAGLIAEGYTERYEPLHGYYFKVLTGQGPAAPLGEMDFLVDGAMIGGFALVAAPADYGVTGLKTFIVSHDGIVYEKDFGAASVDEFRKMTRYNPDSTWTPVQLP